MKNINIKAFLAVLCFWVGVGALIVTLYTLPSQLGHIMGRFVGFGLLTAAFVIYSTLMYELLALTTFRKD
jgi:hypothetical protein